MIFGFLKMIFGFSKTVFGFPKMIFGFSKIIFENQKSVENRFRKPKIFSDIKNIFEKSKIFSKTDYHNRKSIILSETENIFDFRFSFSEYEIFFTSDYMQMKGMYTVDWRCWSPRNTIGRALDPFGFLTPLPFSNFGRIRYSLALPNMMLGSQ